MARLLLLLVAATATWWTAAGSLACGWSGAAAFAPGTRAALHVRRPAHRAAVAVLGGRRIARASQAKQQAAAHGPSMRVREEESALASRGYNIWYSVSKRCCCYRPHCSPAACVRACVRACLCVRAAGVRAKSGRTGGLTLAYLHVGQVVSPEVARPQRIYKQGSCTPLPIVVLHGGPGVPSDYVFPLKTLAAREQRKMFFYDQLGCGRSEGPKDESFYSVQQAAEDGVRMLEHFADFHGLLDLGGFHLYGHSWGGCLAVEIVLQHLAGNARLQAALASVVLSNTPDSPTEAMDAARKLINEYKDEMWGLKPDHPLVGMPAEWPRGDDEAIQHWKLQKANEKFEKTHNLRLDTVPEALQRAYSRMGVQFYGEKSVRGWKVGHEDLERDWPPNLPVLVMRGEHDFVSMDSVAPYVEGIGLAQYAELAGLSHMAHLEDEARYKGVLDGWLLSVEGQREARLRRALSQS
jgi:proline-specific peptidase